MSGQLRTLKNRIRSVESTQKITKAMEMVATAKLKRYQFWMEQSAPYEKALTGVLARLMQTDIAFQHPLLEQREGKKTAIILITSDTGLCGSFNHDLIELAKGFLKEHPQESLLIGFGKNGVGGLSRAGYRWQHTFKDTKTAQLESVFTEICHLAEGLFSEKKVDSVYVIYSHLISKSFSSPVVKRVLPFELEKKEALASPLVSPYIMEPDPATLFTRLLPLAFESQMRMLFLESLVAEQTARMNAMHQATENAGELIDTLVLLRNKVRQAAITNELIEIVSGSQALKGK